MENIIEVKKLVKIFGKFKAVDDISFNVKKGEIFGFLGPNGAGKSTTIKILTTLLHATNGDLKINGYDPKEDKDEVRKSFGIVFQDPSLDEELTVAENMHFHAVLYKVPASVEKKRTAELLEIVDLMDRKHDFVKTFSGMRFHLRFASRPSSYT
jgi:ABC-2 type transport system ATP-binding protein